MSYCVKCGKQLDNEANFCPCCGNKVENQALKNESNKRKTIYEGEIHRCPSCGELIKSFEINCPTCGYELRNKQNSLKIEEFTKTLSQISDYKQKADYIRNFVVPNTKEDLYNFMLLAKTNLLNEDFDKSGELDEEETAISIAWKSLAERLYSISKISFKGSDDFLMVESLYLEIVSRKKFKRKKQQSRGAKIAHFTVSLCTLIVGGIFVILQLIFSLTWKNQLMLCLTLTELILMILALFISVKIIKFPKNLSYISTGVCYILALSCVISCDGKEIIWNSLQLGDVIPEIIDMRGHVHRNNANELKISVYCDSDLFSEYKEKCKQLGFVIDAYENNATYNAFNDEGYRIEISYKNKMRIYLSAPKKMGTINLLTIFSKYNIPVPNANYGVIESVSERGFTVYLGSVDLDFYQKYVDEVFAAGFHYDCQRTNTVFSAKNEEELELTISYVGFNSIYINLHDWS